MGKKDYLARQQEIYRANYNDGLNDGVRIALEMISLVLHDSEIMGKDIFGKDRLLKVVNGISAKIKVYQKAWGKDDETDYYRDKLDAALAEAYGEEMHDSFLERYQFAPEYDYGKGKWRR